MNSQELLNFKEQLKLYIEKHYEPEIYEECYSLCDIAPKESKRMRSYASRVLPECSLDDAIKHIDDTFQEKVFYHIDTKGLDEVKVYNDAHVDRRVFSKLRSNRKFKPSKKTAICLCIGLKLNLDETKDLLEKAGYSLSHSSVFDIIIEYSIKNELYNIDDINSVLYDYQEDLLYL